MRAEDIFYKANVIYLKSLTCLRSQLLTTLTTRYDACGSGWLTTLAKNNLLGGEAVGGELEPQQQYNSIKAQEGHHPPSDKCQSSLKLVETLQLFEG